MGIVTRKFTDKYPSAVVATSANLAALVPSCKLFLSEDDLPTGTSPTWPSRVGGIVLDSGIVADFFKDADGVIGTGGYVANTTSATITGAQLGSKNLLAIRLFTQAGTGASGTAVSYGDQNETDRASIMMSFGGAGATGGVVGKNYSVNAYRALGAPLPAPTVFPIPGLVQWLRLDSVGSSIKSRVFNSGKTTNCTMVDNGVGGNTNNVNWMDFSDLGGVAASSIGAVATGGQREIALFFTDYLFTDAEADEIALFMLRYPGVIHPLLVGKT